MGDLQLINHGTSTREQGERTILLDFEIIHLLSKKRLMRMGILNIIDRVLVEFEIKIAVSDISSVNSVSLLGEQHISMLVMLFIQKRVFMRKGLQCLL